MLKLLLAVACVAGLGATAAPRRGISVQGRDPDDALCRGRARRHRHPRRGPAGMSKVLGRQFLVENIAGAGGTIGTAKMAASPPDGYSLLVMHLGHAANTALYRNLSYDAMGDFEPIGMVAECPWHCGQEEFPRRNFKELPRPGESGGRRR